MNGDASESTPEKPPAGETPDLAGSVKYIMKRTLGADQAAITPESVEAVQHCATEFISLLASEARHRKGADGKALGYADAVGALTSLGFNPLVEPLKAHIMHHYSERASKRPRPEAAASPAPAYGASSLASRGVHPPPMNAGAGAPIMPGSMAALQPPRQGVVAALRAPGGPGAILAALPPQPAPMSWAPQYQPATMPASRPAVPAGVVAGVVAPPQGQAPVVSAGSAAPPPASSSVALD